MDKNSITRKNFSSSLLRQIVLRVDYSEMSNIDGAVQTLNPLLKEYFANRGKYTSNNINVTLDPKELQNQRIPVSIMPPQDVYRFSSCKLEPIQDVILDIAGTFVCMIIKCNESYDKIDEYLHLGTRIISAIREYDTYVDLQRIAIRKIDGETFPNIEEAKTVFEEVEQAATPVPFTDTYQYRVSSFMMDKNTGTQVNLSRTYTKTDDNQYQVELDIDGYIQNAGTLQKVNNDGNILKYLSMINEQLFELFKLNVTEAFLQKGIKE